MLAMVLVTLSLEWSTLINASATTTSETEYPWRLAVIVTWLALGTVPRYAAPEIGLPYGPKAI
jgi:hypothetical protein